MRNVILFLAFSVTAFGQCGILAYNPITHMLDCTGPASSGGTPGGSTTQCQYNNAGAFGGITGCTTNGTAVTLVAPALGTPTALVLTNATGLPAASILPGTFGAGDYTVNGNLSAGTSVTINASTGNIVTTGTITSQSGSGIAGSSGYMLQGTAPSVVANSAIYYVGTSVTGYRSHIPDAAATGLLHWSSSGVDVTESVSAVVNADLSGLIGLAHGGLNLDLTATGGTSRVLKQTSSGGAITVARLACADLSDAASTCSTAGAVLGANTFTGAQTMTNAISAATGLSVGGAENFISFIGSNANGGPTKIFSNYNTSEGALILGSFSNSANQLVLFPSGGVRVGSATDPGAGYFQSTGYKSSDGTAGATTTCTILSITAITVKNGLITGCS